jgi:hypothetical protein
VLAAARTRASSIASYSWTTVAKPGRRRERLRQVRGDDGQLAQLDEPAEVVVGDLGARLGDEVGVDVKGHLDGLLEDALCPLALPDPGSIVLEREPRDRP